LFARQVGSVGVLAAVYFIKVTDMKNVRSRVVAAAIAANLLFSPFSITGDTSKFAGKKFTQTRDQIYSLMKGRNYVVEVDRQGNIRHVIDTGANGSGQDPRQARNSSSASGQTEPEPDAIASVDMPVNYQGQIALDFLGSDLSATAEQHGLTLDKLKELLLTDKTIRIDGNKRIFFTDDSTEHLDHPDHTVAAGNIADVAAANNLQLPIGMSPATVDAFKLHSKPKASKTIYLDFNGHTATNTFWSTTDLVAPPFDLDGNPNIFNTNELSNIISIWSRVAEDFIPFDVDVTTEEPPADALQRSSQTDYSYGIRVVITKSGTIRCYCGGIAYVGVAAVVNGASFQPAWVFQQALANNEKYIAEAASHEAGHNLGLFHDGQKTVATVNYYYDGHGTGSTSWGPIMGAGYYKNVTQWSNGQYPGANNQQDDLAVLAANGFSPRADDAGNTFATASPLITAVSESSASIQTAGVIETANDVDMFKFDTTGGLLELKVKPSAAGSNLDAKLTLFQENGAILTTSAQETELSASISTSVTAGTYFLSVSGSSHSATGTDYGYPVYGSLGQYLITGTYATSGIASVPNAVLTASKLAGPASLSVNFSANRSQGNGNIIRYQWSFGDGSYASSRDPVHTYTKAGTYKAALAITNQFGYTSSKSVEIKVTPPPTVKLYASSLKLDLIKNGNVLAKAAVTVVDGKKQPIPNAVVRGVWSGSFSGTSSSKTGANGIAVETAKPIPVTGGGAANFTLTKIEYSGKIFRPGLKDKKIVTVSW
jgi:PKD repeat protein